MTTLKNEFHSTEATTRLTLDGLRNLDRKLCTSSGATLRAARRAARKIEKQLCGIDGCTCGDVFGARPSYESQLES